MNYSRSIYEIRQTLLKKQEKEHNSLSTTGRDRKTQMIFKLPDVQSGSIIPVILFSDHFPGLSLNFINTCFLHFV